MKKSDRKKVKGNPEQDHAAPEENGGEEISTNRHIYIEPGAQIDFVADLRKKYDAAQESNTTHSNKILYWTKISAFLLFTYAGLTAWQGCLTRTAIRNARDNFAKDQQPIVWIVQPYGEAGKDTKSGQFTWNIHYKNFGKSPAFNVRNDIRLLIGKDAMSRVQEIGKISLAQTGAVEPPGGADDMGSAHPFLSLTDKEIADLYNIENGVVVYGRIDYSDAAGEEHWSTFCMGRQVNGAVDYCPSYSRMK